MFTIGVYDATQTFERYNFFFKIVFSKIFFSLFMSTYCRAIFFGSSKTRRKIRLIAVCLWYLFFKLTKVKI